MLETGSPAFPQIVFKYEDIESIIAEYAGMETLFVADFYNYPKIAKFGRTICVEDSYFDHGLNIEPVPSKYSRVVAVGGCTALDVGRMYAGAIKFIAIPTILSTSCISVNISIMRTREKTEVLRTVIPDKTIIPMKFLLEQDMDSLVLWSASGYGDLFANISASIDNEYQNGSLSLENIMENAREAFHAVEWVKNYFSGYTEEEFRRLATYLHNSSLDVIRHGNIKLSAGCEHEFYEKIIRRQDYRNSIQTHGMLVGIGTLITAGIYGKLTSQESILRDLLCVFKKVGLPTGYDGLEKFGITREHIVDAIQQMDPCKNILHDYFTDHDFELLDTVFNSHIQE